GASELQARLIVWLFLMRILMIVASVASYLVNQTISKVKFGDSDSFDFEAPLTSLVWVTSIVSIALTYTVSYAFLEDLGGHLWARLATIISCGTLAAAIIPELTKFFTSAKSRHVSEIVTASR